MKHAYRIEQTDQGFAVYDRWGVQIDVYKTEDDARKEVDEWKYEEAMRETAKHLVDIAVKTLMRVHNADPATARCWILNAAETLRDSELVS
jgi:hypothetical protein